MWNPSDLKEGALPPCHILVQFNVSSDSELSCQFYIRSNDLFLGAPFNIASYALLTHMIAQCCDLGVGDLIHTIGSAHLYLNHVDQALVQLKRKPLPKPTLWLNPDIKNIDDFSMENIKLIDYIHHDALPAPMAV